MAMKSQTLEFGAWEPDAPILSGKQAVEARNVIPGKVGYRPLHGIAALQYPALSERCIAAFSLKDTGGNLTTLAATASGIFSLEAGLWVSKYTGSTVTEGRSFVDYGASVYALFGNQLLKSVIRGMPGAFSLVPGAPNAEVMGVVRDFLVLGRMSDHANGIRWSAMDDPDSWPSPGSNDAQYKQSDTQIFPVGGKIQAVVGGIGGVDGLIFLESAIQRATYVGTPYFFQFDPVDLARGCLSPASPVVCGNVCIYLAPDGWRLTDGASVKAIGAERIDDWFFATCASDRTEDVRGAHDSEHRLALWIFATPDAPTGTYDRVLIYNYVVDRWSYGVVNTETIFPDYTRGISLDELDVYGTLDALPFASLDSAALKIKRAGVSVFDTSHKLARFSGPTLEAALDTNETGGSRMMVHGFRPLVDSGDAQAMPVYRSRQMDRRVYGAFTAQSRDGVCYHHLSTNYLAARVMVPAGSDWRDAVGVEALVEEEGGM